jgi:hypothetical protein
MASLMHMLSTSCYAPSAARLGISNCMNRVDGVGDAQFLIWIDFLTGVNPIYFVGDGSVVRINFGRNPDIKSVHLTDIRVGANSDVEITELKWLIHFLSDIGESSRVEEIKLDVHICDNTVDWSLWKGVDHILAETNFLSLRKVDVEILDFTMGLSDSNWFRASCRGLAASLPLLQARGILGHIY